MCNIQKICLVLYYLFVGILFLMIRIRPNLIPRADLRGEGCFICQSRISTPSPPPLPDIQDGKSSMHTNRCGWPNNNSRLELDM